MEEASATARLTSVGQENPGGDSPSLKRHGSSSTQPKFTKVSREEVVASGYELRKEDHYKKGRRRSSGSHSPPAVHVSSEDFMKSIVGVIKAKQALVETVKDPAGKGISKIKVSVSLCQIVPEIKSGGDEERFSNSTGRKIMKEAKQLFKSHYADDHKGKNKNRALYFIPNRVLMELKATATAKLEAASTGK